MTYEVEEEGGGGITMVFCVAVVSFSSRCVFLLWVWTPFI